MKRNKPLRKFPKRRERREMPSSVPLSACAMKRFTDQTQAMLGTHYANKHGVRRGR